MFPNSHFARFVPASPSPASCAPPRPTNGLPSRQEAMLAARHLTLPLRVGPNADVFENYLLARNGQQKPVRLTSDAVAQGGNNRIRLGLAHNGERRVWREMPINPFDGYTPRLEECRDQRSFLFWEYVAMASINSPLLPRQLMLDLNFTLFSDIALFDADFERMAHELVPWSAGVQPTWQDWQKRSFALRYVAKTAFSQLADLHEQGFVHRDLKLDNILYSDEHGPTLADFDLAKALPPNGFVEGFGVALYLPPEAMGEGGVYTTHSDVYYLSGSMLQLMGADLYRPGPTMLPGQWFSTDRDEKLYGLSLLQQAMRAGPAMEPILNDLEWASYTFHSLCTVDHELATLLLNSGFQAEARDRLSARDLACALEALLPSHGDEEALGKDALAQAAEQVRRKTPPHKSPDVLFQSLRQQRSWPTMRPQDLLLRSAA